MKLSENRIQLLIFAIIGISLALLLSTFVIIPLDKWETSNYLTSIGLGFTTIGLIALSIVRKINQPS
jgi:hypothetical protein